MRLIVGAINLVIFLGTQRAPIQKLRSRMLDIANALPRMKLSGHNSDEERTVNKCHRQRKALFIIMYSCILMY